MIVGRDGLGLCVKMVDVGHLHAACGCPEGVVVIRVEVEAVFSTLGEFMWVIAVWKEDL